jgi:hypothetical protein
MGTIGLIVLLVASFFVLRFVLRAKSMAHTANSVMSTATKIKIGFDIARGKVGAVAQAGPISSEKQFYIGYITGLAEEQARTDGQPLTLYRALVAQEADNIMPSETERSMELYETCLKSDAGVEGKHFGLIDGKKLSDRHSSQPYFVELDRWLLKAAH